MYDLMRVLDDFNETTSEWVFLVWNMLVQALKPLLYIDDEILLIVVKNKVVVHTKQDIMLP